MKKAIKQGLLLAAMVGATSAMAQATPTPQPFVYPNEWSVATPQQAQRGGEYRDYTISEFRTLNPFISAESPNLPAYFGSGATLFTQDPRNGNFIPKMAQNVQVQNGGRRFLINLRQGMKFSDGREITAQDFVTTQRIHLDEAVGSNSRSSQIISGNPIVWNAVGRYQLVIDFPATVATAYVKMNLPVYPDHIFGAAYRQGGAAAIRGMWGLNTPANQIVTAGAWTLQQYRAGERVVLRRNPAYGEWNRDAAGQPLPYLDAYSFLIVGDLNAALAAYLAGNTDVFAPTTAEHLQQIAAARSANRLNAELLPNVSAQASSQFIVWNWNRASDPFKQTLFRDVRFRRAMSHLANRQAMVQLVYGGLAQPTYHSVFPLFSAFIPANLPRFEYNLQAAQNLLAQMGFTRRDAQGVLVNQQGRRLEFNLITNAGNNQREQLMRIFADEAARIGVRINAQPVDFNNMVNLLNSTGNDRQWDSILIGLTGGDNIWPFASNVIPCTGNLHMYNTSGQCLTPQETLMTQLYFRGEATLDPAQRRNVGIQLLTTAAQLQPIVYLVSPNWHVSFNSRVGGERPRNQMNAYYGSRNVSMTFIRR